MGSQNLKVQFTTKQPVARSLIYLLPFSFAGAISGLAILADPASASSLNHWRFDPTANQLEVTVDQDVNPRYFLVAEPTRIVVDLPNTSVGKVKTQETYSGAIRMVRVSQFQPQITRIVMELAPEVALAPEQVKLQKVKDKAADRSRWIVRPLIVATASAPPASLSAARLPSPLITTEPEPPRTRENPITGTAATESPLPPNTRLDALSADVEDAGIVVDTSAGVAIAVPPPSLTPAPEPPLAATPKTRVIATAPAVSSPSSAELPSTLFSPTNLPVDVHVPNLDATHSQQPLENKSPAPTNLSTSLPAASSPVSQFPTIRVPAVDTIPLPQSTATASASPTQPIEAKSQPTNQQLPPTTAPLIPARSIQVPPLSTVPVSQPTAQPVTVVPVRTNPVTLPAAIRTTTPAASTQKPPFSSDRIPSIAFGQPLPPPSSRPPVKTVPAVTPRPASVNQQSPLMSRAVQSSSFKVLAPTGTVLSLRYTGTTALNLKTDSPQQEVLLLHAELRDTAGNVIIPAGTEVLGRFETTQSGSRFMTQAIALKGQNRPLVAQSELLTAAPRVPDRQLALFSGVGALAGGLVSGFSSWGFLGGAATGAATSYLTSPKPASVQPGQVIPVRLLDDLR